MQEKYVQLPSDDLIDLWDFTRLIAQAICPSLREAQGHSWLQKKLETQPNSVFEVQSALTDPEREALLRLLPSLPPSPGLSEADRRVFMEAYLTHPDRFSWRPVLVSEEEVIANSFKGLQIQEKHLLALQKEITSGRIVALDQHHISEARAGKNIFIHREDAIRYLRQQRLHTLETPGAPTEKTASKPTRRPKRTNPNATVPFREESTAAQRGLPDAQSFHSDSQIAPTANPSAIEYKDRVAGRANDSSAQQAIKHGEENLASEVGSGPSASLTILRRRQVEERTALSRSAIYEKLDPNSSRYDPTFPKRIHLGASSVGWIANEIDTWLRSRKRAAR